MALHKDESLRLKGYDYSLPNYYFLTICTAERKEIFGKIENSKMILNDFGNIVNTEWLKSAEIRKEIELDEYVIMPNHFHAIVILNNHNLNNVGSNGCLTEEKSSFTIQNRVCTPMQKKSISSLIAGFKSSVTKEINTLLNTPKIQAWQPNYYDRIIRNESEYRNTKNYIANNPLNWSDDDLYI